MIAKVIYLGGERAGGKAGRFRKQSRFRCRSFPQGSGASALHPNISRITFNPEINRCEVEYQVDVTENSNKLASPRGFEPLLPP